MPEQKDGLMSTMERKFGLPKLSQLAGAIEKLPDAEYLRLLERVIDKAEKFTKTAPDMNQVLLLSKELNIEKLEEADRVLARIERVMGRLEKILKSVQELAKNAPEGLVSSIVAEIKKDTGPPPQ